MNTVPASPEEVVVLRQFYHAVKQCAEQLEDSPKSFLSNIKRSIAEVEKVACCGCWGRESR